MLPSSEDGFVALGAVALMAMVVALGRKLYAERMTSWRRIFGATLRAGGVGVLAYALVASSGMEVSGWLGITIGGVTGLLTDDVVDLIKNQVAIRVKEK